LQTELLQSHSNIRLPLFATDAYRRTLMTTAIITTTVLPLLFFPKEFAHQEENGAS